MPDGIDFYDWYPLLVCGVFGLFAFCFAWGKGDGQ